MKFISVKIIQVLLGIFILVLTFTESGTFGNHGGARDPETGFIIDTTSPQRTREGLILWNGDLRPIVAANNLQMVLLGISRFSGFFMYPALVLVFFSKFRATAALLSHTPFSMFMIEDMHKLHVYCGYIIFVDSTIHTFAHIARWIDQGNINLLFTHKSGISGIIASLCIFLIVIPMAIRIKECIKYEIRKALHYMFLIMVIALYFHTSSSSIPNGGFTPYVFGTLLVWYALDALYCAIFMTELIHTTVYQTLSTGVQMTMKVSKRFQSWGENGGYGYVCFPWIDRNQWHAFSLFENPREPEERQIFMQNGGDWTSQVHEQLQRSSVRPVWIQGPFPSPYSSSIQYDNQILVASGIGITPALSVIRSHKHTRRLNLIWAVRDPAMLQFFLEKAYLDHRGWNLIFYTGKKPLLCTMIQDLTSTNVCVIKSRPNLAHVIPNIIYGVESGEGLPEKYIPDQKQATINLLSERLDELDNHEELSTADKMYMLADMAKNLGYVFQDLVGPATNNSSSSSPSPASDADLSDLEAGLGITCACNAKGKGDDKGTDKNGQHDDFVLKDFLRRSKRKQRHLTSFGSLDAGADLKHRHISSSSSTGTNATTHSQNSYSSSNNNNNNWDKVRPSIANKSSPLSRIRTRNRVVPMDDDVGTEQPSRINRATVPVIQNRRRFYRAPSVLRHRFTSIVDDMGIHFKPWEEIDSAEDFVKKLDQKRVLETWGILYCGGRNALFGSLKKVSKQYGINMHAEAFDW